MSFCVYILKCADGSYYTGHTDAPEARVTAHQQGMVPGYTQSRKPVELVFVDEFPPRLEALERERQIKGWSRRKKEALIQRDWDRLVWLAKGGASTSSPRTEDEARGSPRTDDGGQRQC